jgi:hypothetical protein
VVLLENVMCHSLFAVRLFEGFAVLATGPASVEAGAKLHAKSEVSRRSANYAGVFPIAPDQWWAVLC